MPELAKQPQHKPAWRDHRLLQYLLLAGLLLPTVVSAGDNAFVIKSVQTELHQGVYQLDARIDYRFSEEALSALTNGVPLLIIMDIEVVQQRNWWFNKDLAELEQGYLLIYHALSEQFIINNLNSGTQENYSSLGAALNTLGYIEHLPLIDSKLLTKDANYLVRIRTRLDIESLPAPMRPLAYISSDWQLDSAWVSWPLTK